MSLSYRVQLSSLAITMGYAAVSGFKLLLPDYEAEVEGEEFGKDVTYRLKLPVEHVANFRKAVGDLTHGRADVVDEEGD
jgi:putative IMPACT (imprinted ancient) family translation regulator